jgi:hypothetical protein
MPFTAEGVWFTRTPLGWADFGGGRRTEGEHALDTAERAMGEEMRDQLGEFSVHLAAGHHPGRTHVVMLVEGAADMTVNGPYRRESRSQRQVLETRLVTWLELARSGLPRPLHPRLAVDWGGELKTHMERASRVAWVPDVITATLLIRTALINAAPQGADAGFSISAEALHDRVPGLSWDATIKTVQHGQDRGDWSTRDTGGRSEEDDEDEEFPEIARFRRSELHVHGMRAIRDAAWRPPTAVSTDGKPVANPGYSAAEGPEAQRAPLPAATSYPGYDGGGEREATRGEVDDGATNPGYAGPPERTGGAGDADRGDDTACISVSHWNAGKLHVNCGRPRSGRKAADEESEAAAATKAAPRKLAFLDSAIMVERPTVLFILEVFGARDEWVTLKKWFKQRGYNAILLAGRGAKGSAANGIVAAIDAKQASFDAGGLRLADRVLGVQVKCKADGRTRRFVGLHGMNTETKRRDLREDGTATRACYAQQLSAAAEWTQEGGVICGDFNRVLCESWRVGGHTLTNDDRRTRDLAGWRCACCDGTAAAAHGSTARFTGDQWTRWQTLKGVRLAPTAKIDHSICAGSERGKWLEHRRTPPDVGTNGKLQFVASDHALVTIRRFVTDKAKLSTRRPTPFKVGKDAGDKVVRSEYMKRTTMDVTFEAQLTAAAAASQAAGKAALRGTVAKIVGIAEEAKSAAARIRTVREQRTGPMETPKQRFEGWAARLRAACHLRGVGGMPWYLQGTPMAKCKALAKLAKRRVRPEEAWDRIVAHCRRELTKAGAAVRATVKAADDKLLAAARDLSKPNVDAVTRMQRAWRAMRESRASAALEAVWEGDRPPNKVKCGPSEDRHPITFDDPRFKPELGRIGDKFVAQMSDAPACVAAFEAWCELFMEAFEPLKGIEGGDFELAKELTWEVFLEVLYSMPSGKAVGAGGFHAELLRVAGEPAQRAFYKAMMSDVRGKRVPEEWRTVLYALLVKPLPNNPATSWHSDERSH